ncbi:MAG: 2-C-methyl-D-erythritol 4-phosphate cytidylyltransferase [Porticoccaceae bacterium]
MKLWVVVPAAGLGQRFAQHPAQRLNNEVNQSSAGADPAKPDLPKQYQLLNGKALIVHTLERLLSVEPERVVVAIHPQDSHWHALPISTDPRVIAVEGGAERADSVLRALLALADLAQPDDRVLVHDVARPCITPEDIKQLIRLAGDHPAGGILGAAVTDTVKRVDDKGLILSTEDRGALWTAMTPQLCRYALLVSALEQARDQGLTLTDEASALEAAGHQPRVVSGRRDNIKVTYREDMVLVEAILAYQDSPRSPRQQQ